MNEPNKLLNITESQPICILYHTDLNVHLTKMGSDQIRLVEDEMENFFFNQQFKFATDIFILEKSHCNAEQAGNVQKT
jgi:hypothetical protein